MWRKIFKSFTLLEILLVIFLVALLLTAVRNIFSMKEKDMLKAEGCINNIVGKVSNYFYSALTSRGIYTWDELIFPKTYIISFSGWNVQEVGLYYESWDNVYKYFWFNLTGLKEDTKWWCYSLKYFVKLSWDLNVKMQPWLEGGAGKYGIIINNDPNITSWEIYFKFYGYWYTWRILWKLIIDKRVDLIHYVPCISWTGKIYCDLYAQ